MATLSETGAELGAQIAEAGLVPANSSLTLTSVELQGIRFGLLTARGASFDMQRVGA
jgi:hypothetical protein